ncbi:MAG: sterol desaturase family protein [Daejeonella sp.]
MEKYFWMLSTFTVPVLFLIITIGFYLTFYFRKNNLHQKNKIQSDQVSASQFRRELIYSFISLVIFAISGYGLFVLFERGNTLIYMKLSMLDVLYLPVSILLMMLFHDMYFYWTHRLLHQPGWYQKIHTVHHLSSNPSPFTSLSFHPVEAVIQAAVLPIMFMIIPAHPLAMFSFLIYMVYKNVHGHAGYEFTTQVHREKVLNRPLNYSIYHNWHHLKSRDNYGLYFTLWDRLMKTFKEDINRFNTPHHH